ncbi:MAG: restriction endonuclease subunit S [Veillonellales bacterium]
MTRQMKDSGIEWIGEIPEDWVLNKIGSIYKERNAKVSDKDYEPLSVTKKGIVRQLENAAKTDDGDNRKLVKKNDFVINSRSDRRGSCGISEYDGSVSLINIVLKPEKDMNNLYYNYAFKTEEFADEYYRWGNGIVNDLWSTKWSSMKKIYIPYPILEEQTQIANYLDNKCSKIDETIEKQKQVVEKLKEYKQSVITDAVTKGLNPDVKMKDSGIGVIPGHWHVTKIGNIFKFIGGFAFSSEKYCDETKNQVIRIGNIRNDKLYLENNPVFITDVYAKQAESVKINNEDILFTMTGTKGKRDYFYTLIVKECELKDKKLYLNQRVGCFRKRTEAKSSYYNYLFKKDRILDEIFTYETGTANQGNLGIDSIRRTKVYFPPLKEQEQIANYLDQKCTAIDKAIANKEKLIAKLDEYKKSLIYECVTGKRAV